MYAADGQSAKFDFFDCQEGNACRPSQRATGWLCACNPPHAEHHGWLESLLGGVVHAEARDQVDAASSETPFWSDPSLTALTQRGAEDVGYMVFIIQMDALRQRSLKSLRQPFRSADGFSTCLVLHVSATGAVTLAIAGHTPPHLNGAAVSLQGSLPLGLIAGTEYPVAHLQLNQGDDLTLHTDGVLEAQSESGDLFGFDRTADLLRSRPSVRAIAEAARVFGQVDDITVVKICRTPSEATQSHVAIDLQIATA